MDEYVIVEKSSLNNIADTVRGATGSTGNIAVSALSNEVANALSSATPVQSDWSVNDPTNAAYIKNKPEITSDDDAIDFLYDVGFCNPVAKDTDTLFTDNVGNIFII